MQEYKTQIYYILYLDILGYQNKMNLIKDDYVKKIKYLNQIANIVNECYSLESIYNLKVKIFSDNIVIAIKKLKDNKRNNENIKYLCKMAAIIQDVFLRAYKVIFRGSIVEGELYIDDKFIFGQGIIDAYLLEEKSAIFPRIILSNEICKYECINESTSVIFKDKVWDHYYFINFLNEYKTINIKDYKKALGNLQSIEKNIDDLIKESSDNNSALIKLYWIKQFVIYLKKHNYIITETHNLINKIEA